MSCPCYQLSTILAVAEQLRGNDSGGQTERTKPAFMWVLRDMQLKMVGCYYCCAAFQILAPFFLSSSNCIFQHCGGAESRNWTPKVKWYCYNFAYWLLVLLFRDCFLPKTGLKTRRFTPSKIETNLQVFPRIPKKRKFTGRFRRFTYGYLSD
jgi:hypothetical protein